MTESAELLAQFATKGDETAFAQLVERYFDLVYSLALRQLNGDVHRAHDVAQMVFTDLARKAPTLSPKVVLVGWLHEATRFTTNNVLRSERRRQLREEKAYAMHENAPESSEWEQLRPVLDSSIGELNVSDRNAILLRFFEDMGFSAIGKALGITEDAAQKRISRALIRLRKILARRGVTVSASGLTVLLMTGMVTSAPAGMATVVTTSSLAASKAIVSTGVIGSLKVLLSTKTHAAVTAGAACLFAGGLAALILTVNSDQTHYSTTNLNSFYTGNLRSGQGYDGAGLTNLPSGRHVFGRVPFDVEGVIHLQGESWREHGLKFPEKVEGIVIGQNCRRIHLLHAASGASELTGTKVAGLVIHYAGGEQEEIPIRYGEHVLDWWDRYHEKPADPNSSVAWTGRDAPTASRGIRLQLFQTAFSNPHPDKQIESIDYVSGGARCAAVMVAMTLEK